MQRPTGLLHGLPPDLQAPRVLELLGDVRDPEVRGEDLTPAPVSMPLPELEMSSRGAGR